MITGEDSGPNGAVSGGSDLPGWLRDAFEVLELRRVVMMRTAVGMLGLLLVVAIVAPDLVPPTPAVGMAAGIAAVLVGAAVVLAIDAADTVIRGARHVRALGGRLLISGHPVEAAAHGVAARIDEARLTHPAAVLSVGIVGISTAEDVAMFVGSVARSLAALSRRVLVVDLVSETDEPGVAEVVTERAQLHQAVHFDPDLLLATLGAGGDLMVARRSLNKLLGVLPADIEVCLIVTPAVGDGEVVPLGALDHVVTLVREDTSRRVDLVAAMDALEEQAHDRLVALLPSPHAAPPDDGVPAFEPDLDEGPSGEVADDDAGHDDAGHDAGGDGAVDRSGGSVDEPASTDPDPTGPAGDEPAKPGRPAPFPDFTRPPRDTDDEIVDLDRPDPVDATDTSPVAPTDGQEQSPIVPTGGLDPSLAEPADESPSQAVVESSPRRSEAVALADTAEMAPVILAPRPGRALGEPLRIPVDTDVTLLEDDRDGNLDAAAALHAFASELADRASHGPQE